MQNRHHFLEIALEKSIESKDSKSSASLIKTINKTEEASLLSFDQQGRSFLFLALEMGAKQIAATLFSLQENNDDILFKTDQNKQTILNMAASQGYFNIAVKLIEIAEQKQKMNVYLATDNDGFTVLHHAANHGRDQIVELILKIIMNHNQHAEFINQVNKDGDTALHNALKFPTCKSIGYLIDHGSKLHLRNNKQITPFKLFSLLDNDIQEDIFSSLNKEKQSDMLKLYRKLLIENPTSIDIKNIYFKLAGLNSLTALLIAQHEFNPAIPIRDSRLIGKDLLKSMPIYAEKVFCSEALSATLPGETTDQGTILIKSSSDNKPDNEILDEDRVTLSSLIDDIENYLTDLRGRSTISTSNRVLAVLIPTLSIITYLGLEPWLIYQEKTQSYPNHFDHVGYTLGEILFGVFGAGGAIGSILGGIRLWNKEINISSSEWKSLINRLQTDLLEKLKILEEKARSSNENYLPTQPQNIQNLTNQITALEQWQLADDTSISCYSQPISKVITIFTRLRSIVETIQQDLNLSRKPISLLFQPPIRVNIDGDSDYDSEDELLPKPVKKGVVFNV
jgi:ankyrin repeat protein